MPSRERGHFLWRISGARRSTVEQPFASLKYRIFGHPRFLLRGLVGAQTEISLPAMVYNLKRMLNVLGRNPPASRAGVPTTVSVRTPSKVAPKPIWSQSALEIDFHPHGWAAVAHGNSEPEKQKKRCPELPNIASYYLGPPVW